MTKVGRWFSGCSSLLEVTLPSTTRVIDGNAFSGLKSLRRINIEYVNKLDTIGSRAFFGCSSFLGFGRKKVTGIEDSYYYHLKPVKIGELAFNGCSALEEIGLSECDSIKYSAFYGCKSLKKVSLLGATYIGKEAFYNCSSLKDVYLSDKLNYIGSMAFSGCKSLEMVYSLRPDIEYEGSLFSIFDYKKNDDSLKNYGKFYAAIERSFKYNATTYVKDKIREWQKKKEYETTSQWKTRVTEETRKKEVEKLLAEARIKYMKYYEPKDFKCFIENYDADAGVYKMKAEGFSSEFYAKVPLKEAQYFKDNFAKVVVKPQYCIKNDKLDIAGCAFTLNAKKYVSPTIYKDDESANVALNFSPLEIDIPGDGSKVVPKLVVDAIDKNIPSVNLANNKTFAVVIGNENYQKVAKVSFAKNDAQIFAKYCQNTLGVPVKNVRLYTDATYGLMMSALKDIKQIAEAYKGDINIIFYYAGHGVPNETNRNAFLLPVDVDGSQTDLCLSVNKLYQELNSLNARSVVVFMDACFSGAQRGEGMLASARGVALKVKNDTPQGNMVVFAAATGDQTAYPFHEKGHGMFTYFLLKKLQETKGGATLGEIGSYVSEQVAQQSVVVNGKSQTPTVVPSVNMGDGWKTMKLNR